MGIVVESLDEAISFFVELVLELEGRAGRATRRRVVQYEDAYRLCYIRGREGLLIGLAEELRHSVRT